MKQRKYTMGSVIDEPTVVFSLILQGEPLFFNGKIMQPGFVQNWPLHLIAMHTRHGRFAWARLNFNWKEKPHEQD